MVKFISYSGCYPNLCGGKLLIEINGKTYDFGRNSLISGGDCGFDEDFLEYTTEGEWIINFPQDFPMEYEEEVKRLVNENIELGCCGGCI